MINRVTHNTIGGKISIFTALLGVVILLAGVFGELPRGNNVAYARIATTSVTVLNTPPQWDATFFAQESPYSASTTPTQEGNAITWVASSSDSSGDNYYLLICKNYASATANNSAAPTCAGGAANLYAVSGATPAGTMATAATTTYASTPEINYWWAYTCDGNAGGATCNPLAYNGISNASTGPQTSPFIVNHRPSFTVFSNDTPKDPGQTLTWTTTAMDTDTVGGYATDTLQLFVCRVADFTGTVCGAGGTWATSTVFTGGNPATSTTFTVPYPKGSYNSFGYIIDGRGHTASGGSQGSNATFSINNITPTISSSSISLLGATGTLPLILTGLATRTQGFSVQYTVSDNNSCKLQGGVTDELNFGRINVFRSGIASTTCVTPLNHNANNCYPGSLTSDMWNVTCTASSTSCTGIGDPDQVWTCTFPLWYIADATDVGSQFPGENWLATAQSADTSFATSTAISAQTGQELMQFLGYDISTTTIAYGGLQPGQSSNLVSTTSVGLLAQGNVGLDETLYGADMCPTYPTCSGNATSTIFVVNQKYASSSMTYAAATSTLLVNPGALFALHVPKTLVTSTPASLITYWGILVPASITLSGNYIGENTIIGVTSPTSAW